MWDKNNVILRFDDVSFSYDKDCKKLLLDEANFSVRENTKITVMGQNGAWKSTIFKLIMWELQPISWKVNIVNWKTVAIARQNIPRNQMNFTLRDYFNQVFKEKDYQLDMKINNVLKDVNLKADLEKKIKDFSWWQQARLLLAQALIQDPDILLLDEPTNNLDKDGIWDLIGFLMTYMKTVIVISHDVDFLNMFTDGVLYLNLNNNTIEQYWWDYYTVLEDIKAQVEKEKSLNARAEKKLKEDKEKINYFANKWWKMRKIAKKMKAEVAEIEESKVDVRKDDKTLPKFDIEFENYNGVIMYLKNITLMHEDWEVKQHPLKIELKKKDRVLIKWPNGIWKSTLLKKLVNKEDKDAYIYDDVKIWYYSQDFDSLDMDMTVWESLESIVDFATDEQIYSAAGRFLLSKFVKNKVSYLSEWQKALLSYARFYLQKPQILVMDEPTNHVNFRHIPVIAEALNNYKWAMVLISHDKEFVNRFGDDMQIVDLWGFL